MSLKTNHLLLTGPPGVGKTTLIRKVCEKLKESNIPVLGFYTEELRNKFNKREGFNVITLDGKSGRLSRVLDCLSPGDVKHYKVGQYFVFPDEFEKLVLPFFSEIKQGVLILDEIGKMELLSKEFENQVQKVFDRKDLYILATVPILKGRMALVESLISDNKVITVTKDNRNELVESICSNFSSI